MRAKFPEVQEQEGGDAGSGRELVKNLGIKEQFDFSLLIRNALVLLLMSKYLKSDIYGIRGFFFI